MKSLAGSRKVLPESKADGRGPFTWLYKKLKPLYDS